MTPQEQIAVMKTKRSEMINQKNRLNIDILALGTVINKLETMAESANNPNLAAELVKPFEDKDQ